jgi:hypothetical protein
MKKILVTVVVVLFILGSFLSAAEAFGFKCSVCGSSSHGSLWHDSDKDGVNDR